MGLTHTQLYIKQITNKDLLYSTVVELHSVLYNNFYEKRN